jgi:hypothetical protein
MDDIDQLLASISLDPEGIARQFMSLSSLFNIVLAGGVGFLVLLVYLFASEKENRDKNLFMVIPVLSILMAVMMRIESPQIVVFFGIFGVLSVIRFRSDLTDQKGITFILFGLIEGVLVGVNAYLLALLAWMVVGGAILLSRRIFSGRLTFRLVLKAARIDPELRKGVEGWLGDHGLHPRFVNDLVSTDFQAKAGVWEARTKLEYLLFPVNEAALAGQLVELSSWLEGQQIEMELKKID